MEVIMVNDQTLQIEDFTFNTENGLHLNTNEGTTYVSMFARVKRVFIDTSSDEQF